jgi:hypothetical protein
MASRGSPSYSLFATHYSPLLLLPGIRQSRHLRRQEKIFCADLKSCDQMAPSGIFCGLIK